MSLKKVKSSVFSKLTSIIGILLSSLGKKCKVDKLLDKSSQTKKERSHFFHTFLYKLFSRRARIDKSDIKTTFVYALQNFVKISHTNEIG